MLQSLMQRSAAGVLLQYGVTSSGVASPALRAAFLNITPSGTRRRYVAIDGNDLANGAQSSPFATINRALSDALPGDQILISSGDYGYTRIDGKSGRADAWITLLPATDSDSVSISVSATNTGTYEALGIINSRFIGVYGLDIHGSGALGVDDANPDRSALSIYGGSHHIRVWACHLHDVPGGGINCFDVNGSFDMLDLSFNLIHGTSRRSSSNTSGISINNGQDLTNGETWSGSDGHAIRIVGNHIYNVVCLVPFTPGGYTIVTDGNGVSLDLMFDTHGYTKPMLVEANIIHGCGARAIHSYGCINVDMLSNFAWNNLIDPTNSPAIDGDPEIDSEPGYKATQTPAQAATNVVYGNIIVPTINGNWRDARSAYDYNVIVTGSQSVNGTNIDRKAFYGSYAVALSQPSASYIAIDSFIPGQEDMIPQHPRALGWSANGSLTRYSSNSTIAAGPLDK